MKNFFDDVAFETCIQALNFDYLAPILNFYKTDHIPILFLFPFDSRMLSKQLNCQMLSLPTSRSLGLKQYFLPIYLSVLTIGSYKSMALTINVSKSPS